jgi:hypothetical protein
VEEWVFKALNWPSGDGELQSRQGHSLIWPRFFLVSSVPTEECQGVPSLDQNGFLSNTSNS